MEWQETRHINATRLVTRRGRRLPDSTEMKRAPTSIGAPGERSFAAAPCLPRILIVTERLLRFNEGGGRWTRTTCLFSETLLAWQAGAAPCGFTLRPRRGQRKARANGSPWGGDSGTRSSRYLK